MKKNKEGLVDKEGYIYNLKNSGERKQKNKIKQLSVVDLTPLFLCKTFVETATSNVLVCHSERM